MKKGKRSETLLQGLRKKIIRRKSLLNSKEACLSNVKNVGSREDESEHLSNILLYDSVYTCPLSIYIDITCDDNKLKSLIINGNPTQKELEETRFRLITEFSEISNNGESQVYSDVISNFYYQRNLILGYELSLKLVIVARFDKAIEYLNQNGMKCSVPNTEEEYKSLIKAIQLKIKNRIAKYKEARSKYNALSSGKTEKPTRRYYNKLLVMLSTCEIIKIQLDPKKMTVAEFAEYLNIYNEYQNQQKIKNNRHGGKY